MGTPNFSDVQAVYFDLDDTLCAYWEAAKAGIRVAFELNPVEGSTCEEMLDHWAHAFHEFCPKLKALGWYEQYLTDSSSTRTELMRRALALAGVTSEELAGCLSEAYMLERDQRLKLFPDAIELLDFLRGRKRLGLMTNGPADLQRMEIATLGIADRFDQVFIEGEMGLGKPSPELFVAAQNAFSLAPSQLLFVGNSYGHDIRPAIAAGWKTAWIRRPTDVPPTPRGAPEIPAGLPVGARPPDLEITSLRELIPLFA